MQWIPPLLAKKLRDLNVDFTTFSDFSLKTAQLVRSVASSDCTPCSCCTAQRPQYLPRHEPWTVMARTMSRKKTNFWVGWSVLKLTKRAKSQCKSTKKHPWIRACSCSSTLQNSTWVYSCHSQFHSEGSHFTPRKTKQYMINHLKRINCH